MYFSPIIGIDSVKIMMSYVLKVLILNFFAFLPSGGPSSPAIVPEKQCWG